MKVLPFYWKRQRLVGEDSWRYGKWTLPCLYTQCCGWRKFYLQINEFVQVNCRHRRKPTLFLFDVSTNAYWIVYKMELWLWISKIHGSTEQNTLLRKYGFLTFHKLVRNVGLKAILQLADKRKWIVLVLIEIVTIVTLSLKYWLVISTTVHVKKLARHWLTTKSWEG